PPRTPPGSARRGERRWPRGRSGQCRLGSCRGRMSGRPRRMRPRTPKRPNVPAMRNPRDFAKPLAIGAPAPVLEIPFRPSRMIHFLDFSNEKMVAKVPDIAPTVDILLGNLEDAVPVNRKEAARDGLVRVGKEMELGETQLWT